MKRSNRCHCDRVRVTIKADSALNCDRRLRVDMDGELKERGRYPTSVLVGHAEVYCLPLGDDDGLSSHLVFDCNPAKIQHWGQCDTKTPFSAIKRLCRRACRALHVPLTQSESDAIASGQGTVTRIHLACHFRPENPSAVIEAIKGELTDRGIKFSTEGRGKTLYVNKTNGLESAHWVLVFYDKYQELMAKRPAGISDEEYQVLLARAKGVLRVELRLNRKIFRRLGLRELKSWKGYDCEGLVFRYLEKLHLTAAIKPELTADEQDDLTLAQQRAYLVWLGGRDLREYMSIRSFQKLAKALKGLGVDITRRHRPPAERELDLATLFQRENLLDADYWLSGQDQS